MKKTLLVGISFIILGYLLGNYIFSTRINIFNRENINNRVYILLNDNKYLAITKDLEVVEILQNIYKYSKIEEKNINSKELVNNIREFDTLVKSSNNKEDILTIEEVVVANYKEVCSKSKNFCE